MSSSELQHRFHFATDCYTQPRRDERVGFHKAASTWVQGFGAEIIRQPQEQGVGCLASQDGMPL
jgi:hypothetical protein